MEELLFIINPIAGGGKTEEFKERIEAKMRKQSRSFKILLTTKPKDAIKMAFESDIKTIVAVGGDGTVSEVAEGIIKRGYGILGIVPGGTGNDLIKSIGMEEGISQSIETILKGKTSKIDVGTANGRIFLNIGGIGLDVEVLRRTEIIRKYIKGKASYILSVLITLIKFKKMNVEIKIDKKTYKRNLVLFAAGNGRFYGGGLQMVPHAKIDDGYLHITIVKDISNFRILTIFPEIFKGTHIRHKKYVETLKSKNIKIFSKKDLYMNLDGEVFPAGKELEFCILDDKIEILTP